MPGVIREKENQRIERNGLALVSRAASIVPTTVNDEIRIVDAGLDDRRRGRAVGLVHRAVLHKKLVASGEAMRLDRLSNGAPLSRDDWT